MLGFKRELADILFIFKLINGTIDSPDLLSGKLSCILFNIPSHIKRSLSLFYIPTFNINYLKNTPNHLA